MTSTSTAELIAEHRGYVRAALSHFQVPPAALDDAEQEVFMVLVRRIDDFDPASSYRRWLWGISRHVALAFRRRALRPDATWQPVTLHDHATRPPFEERLDAAVVLEDLDPSERSVWLARVEGRSAAEIAAAMELPLTTVQWRIRTAGARIRSTIAALGRRCHVLLLRPLRIYALSLGSAFVFAAASVPSMLSAADEPAPLEVELPEPEPVAVSRGVADRTSEPPPQPQAGPAGPQPQVTPGPPVLVPEPVEEATPPKRAKRRVRRPRPNGKVQLLTPIVHPGT